MNERSRQKDRPNERSFLLPIFSALRSICPLARNLPNELRSSLHDAVFCVCKLTLTQSLVDLTQHDLIVCVEIVFRGHADVIPHESCENMGRHLRC